MHRIPALIPALSLCLLFPPRAPPPSAARATRAGAWAAMRTRAAWSGWPWTICSRVSATQNTLPRAGVFQRAPDTVQSCCAHSFEKCLSAALSRPSFVSQTCSSAATRLAPSNSWPRCCRCETKTSRTCSTTVCSRCASARRPLAFTAPRASRPLFLNTGLTDRVLACILLCFCCCSQTAPR